MKVSRSFFINRKDSDSANAKQFKSSLKRDKEGRVHIALYSELFSNLGEKVLCTNSMYADLKDDISASVEPFSSKEKIAIDVFEPKESSEFDRESAIIGFRRFVNACYSGQRKQHLIHLLVFSLFLLLGLVVEFVLYGLLWDGANPTISMWVFKSIEIFATVFIWQFVVYLGFEMPGEIKTLRRLSQIASVDFEFKHWE